MWPSAGIARSSGRRRQNEHRYFCEGSVSDPHEVYIGPLHHENQIFFTFSSLRWFAHLQNSPSTLPHHLRHRERTHPLPPSNLDPLIHLLLRPAKRSPTPRHPPLKERLIETRVPHLHPLLHLSCPQFTSHSPRTALRPRPLPHQHPHQLSQ